MMQLTHALSGAAAGKFLPNPILAFVAGIFVHLLIDGIPHYWPLDDKKLKTILLVLDYFFVLIFIFVLLFTEKHTPSILGGIAGSLVLDILLVGVDSIKRSKSGVWHKERQSHRRSIYSFATDLLVITFGALIVFFIK